jgi:prepilin-type N-terminal cleavage/methylation domain-containing protein/prepilin-type processing-associated H-X9-DG protein
MRPPSNRSAFTLVELLVVIAIIGVLISLLLPALSRARQQANLIACQSNIRQIVMATQMYVNDYHQTFPPGRNYSWEVGPNPANSPMLPSNYWPTLDYYNPDPPSAVNDPSAYCYIQNYLMPYLHPTDKQVAVNLVWHDPGLPAGQFSYDASFMDSSGATQYRYNIDYAAGYKTSRVKSAVDAMLYFCAIWPDWPASNWPHKSGSSWLINVGYVDGHVESHSYVELQTGHNPLYKNDPTNFLNEDVEPGQKLAPLYRNGYRPSGLRAYYELWEFQNNNKY